MKYLLVLGIIALIFYLLLFWRLRRYFPVVRQIFGITRQLYRMTRKTEGVEPAVSSTHRDGERLVRCASCGTWIPSGRAVQLKAKASSHYCSTSCLENAAAQPSNARRSAKG